MVKLGSFIPGDVIHLENGNYYSQKYGELTPELFRKINETESRLQLSEYVARTWEKFARASISGFKKAVREIKRIVSL